MGLPPVRPLFRIKERIMFEFFKSLFNKVTPIKAGEPVHIDITNKKIKINGNKISIPCDIEGLT